MLDYPVLKRIVDIEYSSVVKDSEILGGKLRIYFNDTSVADIWFSSKIKKRFSLHWERQHLDGKIFRHDNFPDPRFKKIKTFPKHFHNASQDKVEESRISDNPLRAVREFMNFIKKKLEIEE